MRRILFVLGTVYLPRDRSGANVSLHALCRRLVASGYDPVVACAVQPGDTPGDEAAYAVLRLADPAAALRETVARLAPDAVVLRAPEPAARILRAANALDRPLHVYFESGFAHRSYPSPRRSPHLRYAANSPFLAGMAQAYLGASVAMVPPVIEPEDYRCQLAGAAVLFVNPIAIKGVHLAAAIAARMPHRAFLFARSWPDYDKHPHLDVRLPNVEWAAPARDMRPLYARTRMLLVPSVWEESAARVIGEAQVSGIPAVASDRGGLRESVGSGGIVLSLAEPVARWCAAIDSLFTDAALHAALARGAKAQAERPEYLPQAVVARFLGFVGA